MGMNFGPQNKEQITKYNPNEAKHCEYCVSHLTCHNISPCVQKFGCYNVEVIFLPLTNIKRISKQFRRKHSKSANVSIELTFSN